MEDRSKRSDFVAQLAHEVKRLEFAVKKLEQQPLLVSQEEFCGEDWNTDFTRDQYLCRVSSEWFVSRMYYSPAGYFVKNGGIAVGAFEGDEEFSTCCDEIWLLPYEGD